MDEARGYTIRMERHPAPVYKMAGGKGHDKILHLYSYTYSRYTSVCNLNFTIEKDKLEFLIRFIRECLSSIGDNIDCNKLSTALALYETIYKRISNAVHYLHENQDSLKRFNICTDKELKDFILVRNL